MPTLLERIQTATAALEAGVTNLTTAIATAAGFADDAEASAQAAAASASISNGAQTGDVTKPAGSAVTTISAGAVTLAKLAAEVVASVQSGMDATKYQGTWTPATNTPTIPAAAAGNLGQWYFVAAAGTATGNAAGTYAYGDCIVSTGSVWRNRPAPPTVITAGSLARSILDADARLTFELGTESTQRTYPAVSGVGGLGSDISAICSEAVTANGVLSALSLHSPVAGSATLFLCSVVGSAATIVPGSSKIVSLSIGVNNITDWNPDISAGMFVGVYCLGGNISYQSGVTGKHTLYAAGLISTSTALTQSTNNDMRIAWKIQAGPKSAVVSNQNAIASINATLSKAETTHGSFPAGEPDGPGRYLGSGYTAIRAESIDRAGVISEVSVNVNQTSSATLCLLTINGSNQVTLVASKAVALVPGPNIVKWGQAVAIGQRLGVYVANGGAAYAAGTASRYCLGIPGTNTATTLLGSFDMRIGWKFQGGFSERILSLETSVGSDSSSAVLTGAGLNQLASADNTGSIECSDLFASAIVANPYPFVRAGSYLLSSVPRKSDGFWGPGVLVSGGVNFPLPLQPGEGSLLSAVRAGMAGLVQDGSPHVLIGDSLSAHFTTTALSKHWFNRLEDWLNFYNAPGSEPATVVVRNDDGTTGETAAFYGLTVSGGSNGTRGPVGKSVILAAGDYIEFTGAYSEIDVFYQRESGAGNLIFSFNGVGFKTLNCAGSSATDLFSGPSATGQTGSGTYRIAASVGPVEVTGLVRHAPSITSPAGTPAPIYHMRAAYGGYTGGQFTDARLDAIVSQATRLRGGARPEYTIALLTNDALFGSAPRPATYEGNLRRIIAKLKAGGYSRLNAICPTRPLFSSWGIYYTAGQSFDTFSAVLQKVCADEGVNLLRLDEMDFETLGLFHTDKLHWSDAGNQKVFETFARWRAGR